MMSRPHTQNSYHGATRPCTYAPRLEPYKANGTARACVQRAQDHTPALFGRTVPLVATKLHVKLSTCLKVLGSSPQ